MTPQRRTLREPLLERYAKGERNFRGEDLDDERLDLRGTNLSGVDFSECFILADFRGANLTDATFEHSIVKTCDFRAATLTNVSFRGAVIDGTKFDSKGVAAADFEDATEQGVPYENGQKPLAR